MVVDAPAAAELGILVAERVQRVRVAGDDAVELAAGEGLDVVLRERLEQPLLAGPSHVVAGVALPVVEDAEVHAGSGEQARERTRDALRARIEARVVADEPHHVDRLLAGIGDLEVELVDPAPAPPPRLPERVPRAVDRLERRLEVRVELPLLDQPAPQLVDDRRLLDPDRADLDTRVALHA